MSHDEIIAGTWRDKRDEWVDVVKSEVLCTVFHTLDIVKQCRNLLDLE